ncbi:hypothetical protein [Flavobacterium sp.]|uniref:hypothetical protein n=1 Tax=Flavobacterium sp. TaxID=239 RepID=UPI0039E5FB56
MAKKFTDEEILNHLKGKNLTKFRKALTFIGDYSLSKYSQVLHNVLNQKYEVLDGSSESQYFDIYELCMTLGFLNYKDATLDIQKIAKSGCWIICMGAGCAYIRLSRSDKTDFSTVFELFDYQIDRLKDEKWGCATFEAALFAVNFDRMVPDLVTQQKFIDYCSDYFENFKLQKESYGENGIALIASCLAGFENNLSNEILQKILDSELMDGHYAKLFAKKALENKYSHYDPSA